MAERRMFAKTIIDSDAFLDMPMSTQCLYFHLSMRADDEGFINNPKKITRMIGASEDDIRILIARSFIITFDTGVVVIKHWKIHNYIRGDRLQPTAYADERAMLELKDNGAYTLDGQITAICQTDDSIMSAHDRIGKDIKGKDRIGKAKAEPVVYFPQDEALDDTFKDFIKMRKSIKKPMTDRAIDLSIKDINKIIEAKGNDRAIACIENSIKHNWLSVYDSSDKKATTGSINWDEV